MPRRENEVRRIDAAGESETVEHEVMTAPMPTPAESRGTPGHDVAQASARRARAVRLALGGMTYQQIADELGYADKSAARNLVVRALDRVETRNVGDYRDVQHARLERVHAALWPLLIGSHRPTMPNPEDPREQVPDPSYVDPDTRIKAAGMILRTAERDARLLGLDAPQRIEVGGAAQAKLEDALFALRERVLRDHVEGSVLHVDDDTTDGSGEPGSAASTG